MINYLNINELKTNCNKIHAFGLGFIQIKLNDKQRIHIYTNEIGLTTKEEEIHNHRYNFTSKVLKGKLTNKIYHIFGALGDFIQIKEACDPTKPKDPTQKLRNTPLLITQFETVEGSEYYIEKDTFHRVSATEGTITLIEREETVKEMADIVYHRDNNLVCPFSVNLSEDILWEIVERKLND